ncbi:MAG TPA: helix-turn-helix domain-containing protein [Ohtaekwangia sp.]|uniref:helix-turn-helix domain-containing protein n=1 Tax=Ohtaekwangia sp. TaxID=2066019 RepID=UPI002F927C20
MKLTLSDHKTGGSLTLFKDEAEIESPFYKRDHDNKYFTIAWNTGKQQTVSIDNTNHSFKPQTLLPIMFNQAFQFERPKDVIAWQFNREFYCIMDHDVEVSCVGFLFGLGDNHFIAMNKEEQQKIDLLLHMFIGEMNTPDLIQHEMLLVLLKRLIVNVTRLARDDSYSEQITDEKFNLMRKFNLLVEAHFRSEHSVAYYAQRLNKSPKTLSNLFALYHDKSPSQVIQERILIEARRLLCYTDKSAKQITYELGFEDSTYFSAYFKKYTNQSPLEYRSEMTKRKNGK